MTVPPTIHLVFILVVASSLSVFAKHWVQPDGTPKRPVIFLLWVAAVFTLVAAVVTTPLNDDEVYWLANSWLARHGGPHMQLPMRELPFHALLTLNLTPSAMLSVGRVATALAALYCALPVSALARKLGCSASASSAVSALTVLWLTSEAQMFFLRPEYIACVLVISGIWLLAAPPDCLSSRTAILVSFVLFTLAATTSLRQPLYLVGAIVSLFIERRQLPRRVTFSWAAIGIVMGVLPSAIYVATTHGCLTEIWYWNVIFSPKTQLVKPGLFLFFPPLLLLAALVGYIVLWARRAGNPRTVTILIMWLTGTIALLAMNAGGARYSMGPWLALSTTLAAGLAVGLTVGPALRRRLHWWVFAACLINLQPLIGPLSLVKRPKMAAQRMHELGSQLELVDWLDAVNRGGTVLCVVPYHPIRAHNPWGMWDAHAYCYLRDPALNHELATNIKGVLRSSAATVIQWDPWPVNSGYSNILQHAVARGLLSADQLPQILSRITATYQIVEWARPLPTGPYIYGGGRFLLRRDIPLDGRVRLLDQTIVRRWDLVLPMAPSSSTP